MSWIRRKTIGKLWKITIFHGKTLENHHWHSGFSHWKWVDLSSSLCQYVYQAGSWWCPGGFMVILEMNRLMILDEYNPAGIWKLPSGYD
jgi:hypothetical protein